MNILCVATCFDYNQITDCVWPIIEKTLKEN